MALRHHESEREQQSGPLLPLKPRDFNESLVSAAARDDMIDINLGAGYPLADTTPTDAFGIRDSGDLSNALNRYVVDVFRTNDPPAGFLIFASHRKGIQLLGNLPAVREEDFSPSARVFSAFYDRLRGAPGAYAGKNELLGNLSRSGGLGASWLIKRLLQESQIDAREAGLEALVQIGRPAVPFVIAALLNLQRRHDPENSSLFLRALRWFRQEDLQRWGTRVESIVRHFTASSDEDVRETAYRCTENLPKELAISILTSRRASESNLYLRDTIEELLQSALLR